MSAEDTTNDNAMTVVLDDTLGITDVDALFNQLKDAAAEKKNILLDASRVNSIDTTSIQLLIAFISKVQSFDCEVNLINTSDIFQENISLLNLEDYFQKAA